MKQALGYLDTRVQYLQNFLQTFYGNFKARVG